MTVTHRRSRKDGAQGEGGGGASEPGIKYTCDFCHLDITHTVRIKCAEKQCEEVDLCPACFCEGREGLHHKAWHPYKVVEQHSQPIFTPDWGADEELLLISGLIMNGLGNWAEVAQHIGTRTKEECEKHYVEVYLKGGEADIGKQEVGSVDEDEGTGLKRRRRDFMPPMDRTFDIDPDEFQQAKKVRIEEMRKPQALPTGAQAPLASAPTNHEVAGFMPGRLEFEHEVDNDAEIAVKDFEFGLVWKYGGDEQPQAKATKPPDADEDDEDERDGEEDEGESGAKGQAETGKSAPGDVRVKAEQDDEQPVASGSGSQKGSPGKEDGKSAKAKGKAKAEPAEPDIEDEDELEVKLALLDIYLSKLDKREEAKEIIFDRGLTEHKKIQAIERKRPKDERELVHRYKVFAKLQTAQDFETLVEGLTYEQVLRKRIAELQEYRRMGITTGNEAEVYDNAKAARAGYRPMIPRERQEILPPNRVNAGQHRFLHGTPPPAAEYKRPGDVREVVHRVPAPLGRKPPAPLNLANAASLDLLSADEQSLCSILRLLPKPYLTIKEMYIRENERRKGLLKRRDARRMLKIDVNKSGRVFDFLVSSGMLILAYDPTVKPPSVPELIVYPGDHDVEGMTDVYKSGNGVNGVDGVHEIRLDNVA